MFPRIENAICTGWDLWTKYGLEQVLSHKMKLKKCKTCKQEFTQYNTLQTICVSCAIVKGCLKTIKDAKKADTVHKQELRAAKAKLLKVSDWIKKVDAVYNPWVRARDEKAGLPCPSCLRYGHEIPDSYFGKWDCGHYLGKGSHPELRYTEINTWRQCKKCNGGSGNYARKSHTVAQQYRLTMIERIGLDKVEWLESKHEPAKWTVDDLKTLEVLYKARLKQLIKDGGSSESQAKAEFAIT